MINKQELKYIAYAGVFAFVYFVIALPRLDKYIAEFSPITKFFIFNLGFFILLQIILKSKAIGTKINILGSIGIICLIMASDILLPPFAVNAKGELLSGFILSESASDYIFGYVFTNTFGFHGIAVYLLTYLLVPMILFYIAAKLMPNFVRNL